MRSRKVTQFGIATAAIALCSASAASIALAQSPVLRIEIVAEEMCCNGCAQKVAAQLYAAPGVTSVDADVPSRRVTVTAKPSPKLTYERLWAAVEKANGAPSSLVAPDVTYKLVRSADMAPNERMAANRYALEVRALESKESAQRIANALYSVQGINRVGLDLAHNTLFIDSNGERILSPWALAHAAEVAEHDPVAVIGPYGRMTIEQPARTASATGINSTHSHFQGEIQ